MKDRIPTQPGRVKITHADGTSEYVTWERADDPTQEGTPINKATLFTDAMGTRYGLPDATPSKGFEMLVKEWSVSVPKSGWSSSKTNGWYTNQITVPGMKAVYNPIATVVLTSATLADDEQSAFSAIKQIETFDGYIICRAIDVPDSSINIKLTGV